MDEREIAQIIGRVQQRLATAPGVLDAVIDGDRVRLVTREAAMPNPARLLPELDVDAIEVSAVPPRFEDAFIDLLGGGPGGGSPRPSTSTNSGTSPIGRTSRVASR